MSLVRKIAIGLVLSMASQICAASNLSLGLTLGQSSFDEINNACVPISFLDIDCDGADDSDSAIGINLALNITENWGVEVGYVDFGEFSTGIRFGSDNSTLQVGAEAGYVSAVGTLPISEFLSVSARLGAFTASGDITSSGFVSAFTEYEEDLAAVIGASVDFRLTSKLALQARYDSYDELDLASVGIKYFF